MKKIIISLMIFISACSQLQKIHERMVIQWTEEYMHYHDCEIIRHEGNTLYSKWIAVCNSKIYSCYYYDIDSKIIQCELK